MIPPAASIEKGSWGYIMLCQYLIKSKPEGRRIEIRFTRLGKVRAVGR